MASINWEELEVLKGWDLTNTRVEELKEEDIAGLSITEGMWKEMSDLKGGLFYVDFDHGCSIFYNSVIASELGGYIHIRGDQMDNIVYSYHVNHKTILPFTMPFPVLPTSHVLMWEYRLEDDYGETKCIVDSKPQEDEIVVRSLTNDEIGSNKQRLLSIPFDILETIMKICVGVEYINFRATCKQCYLAAPLIQCHNKTSLRRLRSYSLVSPWLVVLDTNRGINTFTYPMSGDHYFMKNSQISILKGSGIYCSRFGWLLVRVWDEELLPHLVFFNPFTKDIHKLPVSYRTFESLCFTAPPTSPNCMGIGFTSRNSRTCVHVFYVAPQPISTFDTPEDLADYLHALDVGSAEPTWRTLELGDISSIRFPTFHEGDLYALCDEGKLLVLKHLLEEDYSWKVIEAKIPGSGCNSEALYYMTKCDQHLLVVIVGKFENSVEVFKHNDLAEEWEKVDDLGKHTIYISDTVCLCIDAQTPEMAKIYFPCLHPTNGKVVFYSLETCLFHTFNGRNMEQYLGGYSGLCIITTLLHGLNQVGVS
uniref:uncharacterized protein LOC122582762 n=1 Tax=Erigeron canadensis TaxID=72917 RepID=UPI001CB89F3E|nr:uncharacterized protein LOC122582762 [Erigeron canadensis]